MIGCHAKSRGLLFLFIIYFCCRCNSEGKNSEQSVKVILEKLGISAGQSNKNEKDSSAPPPPPSPNQLDRLQEIAEIIGKTQDLLVKDPVKLFEAKYLYTGGREGTKSSFENISQSLIALRWYINDLNFKLDNVLPKTVEEIKEEKTVTIVDADWDKLKNDLGEIQNDGTVETKNFHKQNQILFKPGKKEGVDVCVQSIVGRVKLSVDPARNPIQVLNDRQIKPRNPPACTTYTKPQIATTSDLKAKLLKEAFMTPARQEENIVLNENCEWFKEKMKKYWEQLENLVINPISKRGTMLRDLKCTCDKDEKMENCAVKINKEEGDNVQVIYGNELIEAYERSSSTEKWDLIQVVKMNMEKVKLSWRDLERTRAENADEELESVKRKIEDIVELEQLKRHTGVVHDVSQIQDLDGKMDWTTAKYLESISKLGQAKVSMSKSRVAEGIAKSKTFKNYKTSTNFLASTEIVGVNRGDDTSLNNVGKRLGYSESESISDERSIQEKTKVLGRMTSPIGSHQDNIGFNVYSFSKNVERLKISGDEYDKNDAIADIFTQALEIGTFTGVLAVSVSFPLAAPIAVTTGAAIIGLNRLIASFYKTGNEVARIHSQVSLSFKEGWHKFWSTFGGLIRGKRQRDYIDDLVAEKRANDLAVQDKIKFLNENEDIVRGIVFPSREYKYVGGCELFRQNCSKNATLFGEEEEDSCEATGEAELIGSRCHWDDPCPRPIERCNNDTTKDHQYTCQCIKKGEDEFGIERKNSLVNLRDRVSTYLERAVPEDVKGTEFRCKPTQSTNIPYVTKPDRKKGIYSCRDAIGLLQPINSRRDGQAMMFDLGDGADMVILDPEDTLPNLFRMGACGSKNFMGGGGRNEFLFENDPCSNYFSAKIEGGASVEDKILVASEFKRGSQLIVDLEKGRMGVVNGNSNGSEILNVKFSSIEIFVGRPGESELVTVNCSSRTVALRGGNKNQTDEITVPKKDRCAYDLTVVVNEHTNLECSAELGNITVLITNSTGISATFDIYPNATTTINLMFLNVSSRFLVHNITVSGDIVSVSLKQALENPQVENVEIRFRGNGQASKKDIERSMSLYFAEYPPESPFSVMRMSTNKSEATFVHHLLPSCNSSMGILERYGSEVYNNVFDVDGTCWKLYGGYKKDEFLLKSQPLELHGGGSTDDTVRINDQASKDINIVLDLNSENCTGIENVVGAAHKNLEVTCGCDTKMVVVMGTSFPKDPNLVIVPSCDRRTHSPLQIVARGYSKVKVVGEVEEFSKDGVGVVAISTVDSRLPLNFEFVGGQYNLKGILTSKNLKGLQLSLKLQHRNWTVTKLETKNSEILVSLDTMEPVKEKIQLALATGNLDNLDDSLLKYPYIYVLDDKDDETPAGQFIIDLDTKDVKVMFTLTSNGTGKTIQGLLGVANIFKVENSSWVVKGGRLNDVFRVDDSAVKGTIIDGGSGGENTLIMESSLRVGQETGFEIDLESGRFGFIQSKSFAKRNPTNGSFSGIHQVIGRSNLPDLIRATCSTKMVNGRGGLSKEKQDVIEIPGNGCSEPMHMTINMKEKYVSLKNRATLGSFTYFVGDLLNSKLDFKVSNENNQSVVYMHQPWEIIKRVHLVDNSLAILFESGNITHKQTFTLARPSHVNGEYTNPLIKFHQPDRPSLTTDIRVSKEKRIVSATIFVNGKCLRYTDVITGLPVHVNKFIIDATSNEEPFHLSGGTILGSALSKVNMFWIFQLSSQLDILDGGKMNDSNNLELTDSLFPKEDLEIDLDIQSGYLKKIGSKEKDYIMYIFQSCFRSWRKYDGEISGK